MLAQTGLATAENWTFGDGFIERLRYEIDPRWQGEIPRTVLIARATARTMASCISHVRRWGQDWLAGHLGRELWNPCANDVFEIS
jgi:hypothetical protein